MEGRARPLSPGEESITVVMTVNTLDIVTEDGDPTKLRRETVDNLVTQKVMSHQYPLIIK